MKYYKVAVIVVTFNPQLKLLDEVILSASAQASKIYIVDNSTNEIVLNHLSNNIQLDILSNGCNKGIASAFNCGIKAARSDGYEYVVLLDQDSVIPKGMIESYCEIADNLNDKNLLFSAIGPRYRNPRNESISRFVEFNWFRNVYKSPENQQKVLPADFLISSGSFYDIAVFDKVGFMNEDFFIDHVDTEWFLRAKSLGLTAYGAWDVVMNHLLGEREIRLWLLRWRNQPIHKPFRLYYIARNSLLMYRMPHVPLKWISSDMLRLVRLFFMYSVFAEKRLESLSWMTRGLVDGIRGETGPALKK
jgi:rhamnosyltransferase